MPTFGYLVVKTFDRLWRDFAHPTAETVQIYGIPQRGMAPSSVSKHYRGIDRQPLEPFSDEDFRSLSGDATITRPEPEAQNLLAEMEAQSSVEMGLIQSQDDAVSAWSHTRESSQYEIIWVRDYLDDECEIPKSSALLGYEPSYLVSDHFSAVADCLFFPRWHGTDEEGVLFKAWYESLNEYGLFGNPAQALGFLESYRSHEWTERGRWVITEVRALIQT